jgi:hypothetical protein
MPTFEAHMPRVDDVDDLQERFDAARKVERGEENLLPDHPSVEGQHHVVLITPGRMLMQQSAPLPGTVDDELIQSLEQIVPSSPSLNISVIALNEIQAVLSDAKRTIPFFGYLLGLAYVGHRVTIFEGHSSALAIGCADADLVIVDGDMVPFLQEDWGEVVLSGNTQSIFVFHRDGRLDKMEKPV